MRYGLVTTAVAALAVAMAASVLVLDRPTDQAGRKLDESPLYVVGAQTTPAPSPTTAVGPPADSPATTVPGVGSGSADAVAPTADASGSDVPQAGQAPAAAPSPRGDVSSPVAVAPAPAQTVPPANNGKHNGAGKGHGKGDAPGTP
jgi:hypothetical protein